MGYPTEYTMNDIATMQAMYGADFETQSGDTVYSWSPTTGALTVNGVLQAAPIGNRVSITIWDGGGNDTYDFSRYFTNLTVNLNPGSSSLLSTAQTANPGYGQIDQGKVFNAYQYANDPRSLIENAIAGSGNDSVLGNAAANLLEGGAGADTLSGGAGADTLVGGTGDDVYIVDTLSDSVVEASGGGTDLVQVAISTAGGSYTLGAEIENGRLTNTVAFTLNGNSLANRLTGNAANNLLNGNDGNDTLDGAGGADTLVGGAGNDVYIVDARSDLVVEALGGGTDLVRVTIATAGGPYVLTDNVENAILDNAVAFDLTGNGLANLLTGNALANRLDGGAGADTLVGGAGDDVYIVDNGSDCVVEALGGGADLVRVAIAVAGGTYVLTANVENAALDNTVAFDLTGNALANVLTGNSMANLIDGGAGADIMVGGAGDDVYIVDSLSDSVIEAAGGGTDLVRVTMAAGGTYILAANVENAILDNAVAFDLTGNTLANVLTGNAMANRIDGGAGADTLVGGAGNDTYTIDSLSDLVAEASGGGTDLVRVAIATAGGSYSLGAEVENGILENTVAFSLNGNSLANLLTGNAANNVLTGNDGNDTLSGAGGADTLIGGAGDDVYVVDTLSDSVVETSGAGSDLVRVTIATAGGTYVVADNVENAILDNSVAFNLTGNALANLLTGNALANRLDGGAGPDTLVGGAGDDVYTVDNPSDSVVEALGGGADLVRVAILVAGGNYVLAANVENAILDTAVAFDLTGNGMANVLTGNALANRLDGGAGADTLVGGAGNDVYVVDSAFDSVVETAGGGVDLVRVSIATAGGAYVLTDNVENAILDNAVAFDLTGNALANVLTGNALANRLDGGAGADTLAGGAGDDVYVVDSASDSVVEATGAGIDLVRVAIATAGGAYVLTDNVENAILDNTVAFDLRGNALTNMLTGNAMANRLDGGDGADTLTGGAGNDTLCGGAGADRLNGGVGSDVFYFDRQPDAGPDLITDFVAMVDKIDLSQAAFTGLASTAFGSLSPALFWAGAGVTAAHDADDRLVYDTTSGTLYYDPDGMGGASLIALATFGSAKPILTAGDFIIVG